MKLSSKLNPISFLLFALTLFAIAISIQSCKKNIPDDLNHPPKVLSTSEHNYQKRLNAIKELFIKLNLQDKFNPKSENKIIWTPDWNHPYSQIVNDSVSYVFYRLIAEITINNKRIEANQSGSASYLVVKNEREFYRGFYYQSSLKDSSNLGNKISIKHFTGNLILSNLLNNRSFLIRYKEGKAIDNFNKEQKIASLKLMGNKPSISYWSVQCHTEIRFCIFGSDGYSYCGGGVDLIFSENCQWPTPHCGVSYSLLDYSDVQICEDIWFPDPPEPIDTGGGDSGGDGGSAGSNTIPSDPYLPGQDHEAINPKDYTKCFANIPDAGATYKVIVQVLEPVPGTSLNYGFVNGVGHTAITLIKQGSNGIRVTQTVGFYPTTNPFHSPSKIVNNSNQTDYTIRMIFDMGSNATDFNKILNGIENPPSDYDLLEMNCTVFVVGICSSGGISLPNALTTVGVAGAGGITTSMTPGGLGYGMRNAHSQGDNRVSSGPTSTGNNPVSNGPCN
ncbi:hypothetical protein [Pedobacter rhodius]|uniref:Uncharacterized protein n=1 Tax=Pedobacter rhodius TaxID=3004098 RepID=A0ABT4L3A5_9SPHI|nr:hypothetical protein [Pedobacter sp. SJ11]MCZ4225451.1 hypothetical protein [Pedobacter sp. SJ11]